MKVNNQIKLQKSDYFTNIVTLESVKKIEGDDEEYKFE